MRFPFHSSLVILLAMICVHANAQQGPAERRFNVRGFGTLGLVYHDQAGIEYRKSIQQGRGAPAGKLYAGVDSIAGLQVNAAWNSHLELVGQGVFKIDNTGDWRPRLTRFFLRYEPTQEFMVRAGRIGYEQIPGSTSRDIGYSYLGIREPVEVIGLSPGTDFDGADVTLKHPLGNAIVGLNIFCGSTPFLSQKDDDIQIPVADFGSNKAQVWGVSIDSQWQNLLLRIGTGSLSLKDPPPIQPLIDALHQVATPEADVLAAEMEKHGRRFKYYVFAAQYENEPWQSRLSLVRTTSESSPLPAEDLGFIGIGYRISSLTPYLMLSMVNGTSTIYPTGAPDTPQFSALNDLVYSVQTAGNFKQSTVSLGLRYDFASKLDVKFQVDQVRLHDSHVLIGAAPSRGNHLDVTVFGVALDFVF